MINNLEQFITDDTPGNIDSLIKMMVIHHQFESIRPFYDGNGRNRRIIKILYLMKHGLLDTHCSIFLVMSTRIRVNIIDYFKLFGTTKIGKNWVLYILE
ncbi:Fic family protein [Candidatus Protochlamydia amoebophila]|uniref:Fic family protein n=1 Tax=Candidatus Protochlamydia amoebophila TaxID=362787 RepID=UPI001BC983EE